MLRSEEASSEWRISRFRTIFVITQQIMSLIKMIFLSYKQFWNCNKIFHNAFIKNFFFSKVELVELWLLIPYLTDSWHHFFAVTETKNICRFLYAVKSHGDLTIKITLRIFCDGKRGGGHFSCPWSHSFIRNFFWCNSQKIAWMHSEVSLLWVLIDFVLSMDVFFKVKCKL
jgi:hypothetical protein